jgi:hypothetical protein
VIAVTAERRFSVSHTPEYSKKKIGEEKPAEYDSFDVAFKMSLPERLDQIEK